MAEAEVGWRFLIAEVPATDEVARDAKRAAGTEVRGCEHDLQPRVEVGHVSRHQQPVDHNIAHGGPARWPATGQSPPSPAHDGLVAHVVRGHRSVKRRIHLAHERLQREPGICQGRPAVSQDGGGDRTTGNGRNCLHLWEQSCLRHVANDAEPVQRGTVAAA